MVRRGRRLGWTLALAILLAACGSGEPAEPSGPPPPAARDTSPVPDGYAGLRVAELFRLYRLHLPSPGRTGSLPLVIAIHGATDNAQNFETVTGLDSIADREGFVVAYPDGRGHLWNAGGPYEEWLPGVDDVAFIRTLIDTLAARYPIDRARVFATGHSNGGYMTYRLAHELDDRLVAIAPVGASELAVGYPTPVRPVAILHVHALDDTTVPISGKPFYGSAVLPVDSIIGWWRRLQHCNTSPDTLVSTESTLGRRWRSADGRGDVVLYTVRSGGHTWFSARDPSGLAASELIWSFFKAVPPR